MGAVVVMAPVGVSRLAVPGGPPVTDQLKETVDDHCPSETVALTVVDPACVGVPLMMPVDGATVRPAGSPVTV